VGTHWSVDLGIAQLVRALSARTRWPAVLSRFSRLLVDANRNESSDTLFRTVAEGRPVQLNANLSEEEKEKRLRLMYHPYHAAVDAMVRQNPGALVFSLHSFTPLYEGQPRTLEIGVLYDADEAPARVLAQQLVEHGYDVAINEPYSGQAGLMYSAQAPATRHGRQALELEVRQDLLEDPVWVDRLAQVLADALG